MLKGDFMMRKIEKYLIITLIVVLIMNVTACSSKKEEAIIDSNQVSDKNVDVATEEDAEIEKEEEPIVEMVEKVTLGMEDMSWSFKTNGGIASSPIIVDNKIFFGSKDGILYALDLDTNLEIWHYKSDGPILCQPAVHDNTLFFSSSEVFFALDIRSGEVLWKYDTKADDAQKKRKDQWDYHDSSPVIDNNIVYFGSSVGYIYGFDITTGEIAWEFATQNEAIVRHTPLIHEGVMYIGDWSGIYYAIDINTKQTIWTKNFLGPFQSSSAIFENVLVFGGRASTIHAVERATGENIWNYSVGSWVSGDPVIVNGTLYFSTSDTKSLYAVEVESGKPLKKYFIYKNSFSRSVIIDNLIYIATGDAYEMPGTGKVQAFELDGDGKSIWEIDVDTGSVFTTPVILNNMLYFGSEDGSLHAVEIDKK
jgi:outer membrane protein assembly factor BamB